MPQFDTTPIPYVEIGTQAAAVRTAIDAARLSAANSFGGLQKLAIPGPFATDAEANTFGVPDDNLYYRSDGTVRAASHISLDLAFALDKTLTARTGPTPTFTRASGATYVGSDGLIHGIDTSTTSVTFGTGSKTVTLSAPLGQDQMWRVGDAVEIVNTAGALMFGTVTSYTASTQELVCNITSSTGTGTFTTWRIGYRGARFDHDPATGASKGLLIEEPRTNYIVQSENFTSWWATNAGVVSRNKETVIPDPAGTFNSTRLEVNAAFNLYRDPIPSVPDGTRAVSIFARAVTGGLNSIALLGTGATVRIDLATGAVITNTGTVAGSLKVERFGAIGADGFNWWRISYATTDILGDGFYIENVGAVSGAATAFLIFGAQYELGAFPLSYIPTTSGTAARSADVCSIVGEDFSSFYNQSEGSIIIRAAHPLPTSPPLPISVAGFACFDNDFNSATTRCYLQAGSTSRTINYIISNTTANIISNNAKDTLPHNHCGSYKLDDIVAIFDGVVIGTDDSCTPTAVTKLTIGNRGAADAPLNGHIARITYFRKRLSNEKLQTLTAP